MKDYFIKNFAFRPSWKFFLAEFVFFTLYIASSGFITAYFDSEFTAAIFSYFFWLVYIGFYFLITKWIYTPFNARIIPALAISFILMYQIIALNDYIHFRDISEKPENLITVKNSEIKREFKSVSYKIITKKHNPAKPGGQVTTSTYFYTFEVSPAIIKQSGAEKTVWILCANAPMETGDFFRDSLDWNISRCRKNLDSPEITGVRYRKHLSSINEAISSSIKTNRIQSDKGKDFEIYLPAISVKDESSSLLKRTLILTTAIYFIFTLFSILNFFEKKKQTKKV